MCFWRILCVLGGFYAFLGEFYEFYINSKTLLRHRRTSKYFAFGLLGRCALFFAFLASGLRSLLGFRGTSGYVFRVLLRSGGAFCVFFGPEGCLGGAQEHFETTSAM